MSETIRPPADASSSVMDGVAESYIDGLLILSPKNGRSLRRVLYLNSYGGSSLWNKVKAGVMPAQHLWGCLELVRMGYEVAIAEPLPDFYFRRKALPHDLKYLRFIRSWLRADGIVYCGHNVMYWLPLLKRLSLLRVHLVSLLYGREPLDWASAHRGIIALNPAAEDHARRLAPQAVVKTLSWGAELSFFPRIPFQPGWFLSCGRTERDFPTLKHATDLSQQPVCLVSSGQERASWPAHVTIVEGVKGRLSENIKLGYDELFRTYYARTTATLIILNDDPAQKTGVGFTNLIESMAMARPVIITKTGSTPSELDVEQAGCGLHVPANDPKALARAMDTLAGDTKAAEEMGSRGRALCESHYNMARYAAGLHNFFNTL